ncbi:MULTISPECIES: tetratricopeptide repeat protein [Acidobacteriaceae]|uniref:tetratricopeptide repeat protein n=1 Tax=Acidobacteriaceae TaxID=204434 RepID=UPI00210FC7C3|nr:MULTISPECIES: tetratricopeptide repeat protein [Acidobacteriaceae]MDW5264427.1 tetratricopeptide repeat protein [Edaphobacter sp.]
MKVFSFLLLLSLGGVGSGIAQSANVSSAKLIQAHEQRAHELLSQKNPTLAAKEFAAVVALDPNNIDAQANLGVLLFFEKDYAQAEPHLRSAVEQQPGLIKIRALLGMCERNLGKSDLARADLQAVVDQLKEPSVRIEAGLELIELYTAAQELPRAAAVVEALREDAPTDPRILYAAYRIYSDLAGEALLDLSVAAPNSGQMHQAMAHELNRIGNTSGTIADLRKAIAIDPNLPGIHFELAEALRTSSDLKLRAEAEQEYKLAIEANSRDEKAISRLGDIAVEKDDFDGAIAYYQHALALVPGDVDATLGLAHVYIEKDESSSALPLLESLIAADPTNVLAHYRLSTAFRKLKRPADAKREMDAYQKYKGIKEKLGAVYKDMRLESPQNEPDK